MTLESDVIVVLLKTESIRPCEIRRILQEKTLYYKKTDSRLFDVRINRVLLKLSKNHAVTSEYRKREAWYSLTENGRKKARILIIHNNLRQTTEVPPQKSLDLMLSKVLTPIIAVDLKKLGKSYGDAKTISTLNEVTPEGKAPVDVALWLDIDNKDKIDAVSKYLQDDFFLENTAYHFVEKCKQAIIEATSSAYRWTGWKSGSPQFQEMIKTLKTSLDFDAMLMLHFNGKPFVQAYDWKKDLEKYEEHDKILHEKASAFNRLVNQQGKTRSAWTEYSILERLGWLNYNIEVFNNGDHLIAPDIASLKKQVAEHIVGLMIAGKELHNDPEPPSINIIEEFIERMFKDGILELAVTFRLDVNKANALKAERNRVVGAETGYILDSFNDLVRLAANKGTK